MGYFAGFLVTIIVIMMVVFEAQLILKQIPKDDDK